MNASYKSPAGHRLPACLWHRYRPLLLWKPHSVSRPCKSQGFLYKKLKFNNGYYLLLNVNENMRIFIRVQLNGTAGISGTYEVLKLEPEDSKYVDIYKV